MTYIVMTFFQSIFNSSRICSTVTFSHSSLFHRHFFTLRPNHYFCPLLLKSFATRPLLPYRFLLAQMQQSTEHPVNHGNTNKQRIYQSLLKAVKVGRISEERINESVYRILSLKEKYKLTDEQVTTVDINRINKSVDNINRIMNP